MNHPTAALTHTRRHAGVAGLLTLDVIVSLVIGLIIALLVQAGWHRAPLSILLGLVAVGVAFVVILVIACAIHFAPDYTRYMKIRHM